MRAPTANPYSSASTGKAERIIVAPSAPPTVTLSVPTFSLDTGANSDSDGDSDDSDDDSDADVPKPSQQTPQLNVAPYGAVATTTLLSAEDFEGMSTGTLVLSVPNLTSFRPRAMRSHHTRPCLLFFFTHYGLCFCQTITIDATPSFPAVNGPQRLAACSTDPKSKRRIKFALAPGHSPLDWARLTTSGKDLRVQRKLRFDLDLLPLSLLSLIHVF